MPPHSYAEMAGKPRDQTLSLLFREVLRSLLFSHKLLLRTISYPQPLFQKKKTPTKKDPSMHRNNKKRNPAFCILFLENKVPKKDPDTVDKPQTQSSTPRVHTHTTYTYLQALSSSSPSHVIPSHPIPSQPPPPQRKPRRANPKPQPPHLPTYFRPPIPSTKTMIIGRVARSRKAYIHACTMRGTTKSKNKNKKKNKCSVRYWKEGHVRPKPNRPPAFHPPL